MVCKVALAKEMFAERAPSNIFSAGFAKTTPCCENWARTEAREGQTLNKKGSARNPCSLIFVLTKIDERFLQSRTSELPTQVQL